MIYFVEFLQFLDSLISVWVLEFVKDQFQFWSGYYTHNLSPSF